MGSPPAVVVVDFTYGFTDTVYPTAADMHAQIARTRAITDLARLGGPQNRIDHRLERIVRASHFDLHFGNKVHGVLGAPVHLRVAFLPAEPADFRDRHAMDTLFVQCVLDIFKLEMPHNRFDLSHDQSLLKQRARSPTKKKL